MKQIGIFSLVILTALLAGCSYLQSFFPDKERDYQYTTEIPLLNWPTELRNNQAANNLPEVPEQTANPEQVDAGAGASPPIAANGNAASSTETTTPASGATSAAPVIVSEADDKDKVESVEIIKYKDGESRLRIGAGYSKSWRVVSKALSHNSIEVTERDHDKGLFTVHYDPDEKKPNDGSWSDELFFMFHGINNNEQEYHLKLEEHDQKTDVIVLNEEHVPLLNSEPALRLLKVIAETTNADLAGKASNSSKTDEGK